LCCKINIVFFEILKGVRLMNFGKESETLEFKKSTNELREAMVSISAILNKHGVGTLYFGIKPNGDVVGQDVSESSLRDVSRLVYETIKPQIYPVIEEVVIDNRHVIKVEFNGDECPYSASGRYYLRTADEDREVTPTELKQFFVANEYKEKWEKAKTDISAKQVDKKAVKKFCEEAIAVGRMADGKYTVPAILNRFGLVKDDCLTNAGNVLFGNTHPVTLKAAIFATDEKLTFLDMQLYEDNIYNLLSQSEKYILSNIRWRNEIIGSGREELPEIPVVVIREILANSFAHAVYNSNTYHEICIYPNKITIYSPGAYASSYKPEDYISRNLPSSIRNATISKILYLNKSIEQFGSGFKRINSLCRDANIKYSYETSDGGFTFIIYRNTLSDVETSQNNEENSHDTVALNDTERAIYDLLSKNPYYTRNELSESVSKTVKTVQRTLDSLKNKGLIERVGKTKGGYWKIL
jgi:ATP-dependent DNA helicase RecG